MPKRSTIRLLLPVPAIFAIALVAAFLRPMPRVDVQGAVPVNRPARIRPDYSGSVIPPNIAPLNFRIEEPGVAFCARVSSRQGEPIQVASRSGVVKIPLGAWQCLLDANRGQDLTVDVFVQDDAGRWSRFESITNRIAEENIDDSLVYRRMHLTHTRVRSRMGIYRRNLSTFRESVVLSSESFEDGCLNCHSFRQNHWDKTLLGVRSEKFGTATLAMENGEIRKLDKKFGYTSWHPSGRLAVYAVNNIPMFYHSARNEVRDTVDLDSMLAIYRSDTHRVEVEPKLARKDILETWPAWSGDGKYLYFCCAPKLWSGRTATPPESYDRVKYDLVRIAYDVETDKWGQIETVLSASQTGKSIGMPRVSPDGRWLTFCYMDYGYFPTWKQESDLYVMDLQASTQGGQSAYRPLEINSDRSESWVSWSSNSRWIVLSSKRLHDVFTRLFISYVDADGKACKPVLVPQEDPDFYESCLDLFNTPELVIGSPPATGGTLAKVFRSRDGTVVSIPATMATPVARPAASAGSGQAQHE
ncbi:MAG: TolB family protein [Solirubrobacterales bacterium]